jgi:hypothetical protein
MNTRSINTTAHFAVTDATGQESSVYRELALVEKDEGGWLVAVTEPNQDDPEGDVLAGDMISVPDEAAGVFDDLFTRIADPSRLGARTR